jgi:VanZ family protein
MRPTQISKRYPLYLTIALVLLSILFFIGGPKYQSPRSFKAAWNLGHLLFFALLPLLIFSVPKNRTIKPTVQAAIVITITLTLGIIVELLQYGFDRTPDIGDLSRNMIGAMIAIFFLLPTQKALSKPALITMRSITIIFAIAQLYPITIALIDEHQARQKFPILSDFQTPLQIQRWTEGDNISIAAAPNNPDNLALKIDLTTRLYSGTSLKYFPKNWDGYHFFQFRIFNPSAEQISLTCRIHDKKHARKKQGYHDRYNKTYKIPQGWNTIIIDLKKVQQAPKTRNMDLKQIYGIGIFATQLPHPRTIYIDDLKLF